jgi:hypothetical protein
MNTVLAGPTNSGRKGTAKGVVRGAFDLVDPGWWSDRCTGGLSSGEGLIQAVAGAEKRLLAVEEEFASVFACKGRDGSTLSHVIRQAFDNEDLNTRTVDPRRATGAHVSIVGHITPEELKTVLKSVDTVNGFGNRFMWFLTQSPKRIPLPDPIPGAVFDGLVPTLKLLKSVGDAGRTRTVPLDAAAKRLWVGDLYDRLREDAPGHGGQMASRGLTFVMRTALIYALTDVTGTPVVVSGVRVETADLGSVVVRVPHLRAALAVWDYAEESALRLFAGPTDRTTADVVLALLRRHGPLTTTELNGRLGSEHRTGLSGVLAGLKEDGLVRSTPVGHGGPGRPGRRWEAAGAG